MVLIFCVAFDIHSYYVAIMTNKFYNFWLNSIVIQYSEPQATRIKNQITHRLISIILPTYYLVIKKILDLAFHALLLTLSPQKLFSAFARMGFA